MGSSIVRPIIYLGSQGRLNRDAKWRKWWALLDAAEFNCRDDQLGNLSMITLQDHGIGVYFFAVMFIIMGLSCSLISALTLDRKLVLSLHAFMILPSLVELFHRSGETGYGVVFVAILFAWLFLSFTTVQSHQFMVEALRNRELIQSQKDQLAALIDAIPGYVSWTDSEGKYLGVNQRLAERWSLTMDDFRGQQLGFLKRQGHFEEHFQTFLRSNKEQEMFEEKVTFSGWLALAFDRVPKVPGSFRQAGRAGGAGYRRSKAGAGAAVAQARLATLGVMAGGIAHEINNPLTIIQGTASRIRAKLKMKDRLIVELSSEIETGLDRIDQTVSRIAKIIRGLRAIARDGENDPFERVSVRQLISDVLELCGSRLSSRGVEVQAPEIRESLEIKCRPTQIAQVLLNLISNADDAIAE